MRLSIGVKLGILSAIGIALVGGSILQREMSAAAVEAADVSARRQEELALLSLRIQSNVRRMQVGVRDIRLSQAPEQSAKPFEDVQAALAEVAHLSDTAAARAISPENRERFEKMKGLLGIFATFVQQINGATQDLFAQRGKRDQIGVAIEKGLSGLGGRALLLGNIDQDGVQLAVEKVVGSFHEIEAAAWKNSVKIDQAFKSKIGTVSVRLEKEVSELASLTNDSLMLSGTKSVLSQFAAFRKATDDIMALEELRFALVRNTGLPTAVEMAALAEKAVTNHAQLASRERGAAVAEAAFSNRVSLGAGIIVILMLSGSAVFSWFSIARPIRRIGDVLRRISNGDKHIDLPYENRQDEIGDNARAAKAFKDNLLRIEEMEAVQKQDAARSVAERRAALEKLANDFEGAVGSIVDVVASASTELNATASQLTNSAQQTSRGSVAVSAASELASANVRTVAAAVEELSSSIHQISDQVSKSSEVASRAASEAQDTSSKVTELANSAQKIGGVVELIRSIAAQTNLLALNATIEAARAGDAGRGFAVVANEVKALAEQTANATSEISAQIAAIQQSTQMTTSVIEGIAATIGEVNAISGSITNSIAEQGSATQEIARAVAEASEGTADVSRNIANVTEVAENSTTASLQVLSSAQELSRQSEALRAEVGKFLRTVRAA